MKSSALARLNAVVLSFALLVFSTSGFAADDNYSSDVDLRPIMKMINQVDKAIEQLQILDNICRTNCEEYSRLKQMIDSHDQSARNS